jgi:non-homologous end joining protein Ku
VAILKSRRRRSKHYSALRERLKQEDAAAVAKLTPAQRLQAALDLSDFCLMLAAKVREADAHRSFTKSRRGAR